MSLDARVRCTCIRDGKAKPHPFPERLAFDEYGEPFLTGDPTDKDLAAHDEWLEHSCEHSGYAFETFLGNITFLKRLRELISHLQGKPGPRFPILLEQVIYDGTHCGDSIPVKQVPQLLEEVDTILHSRDILSDHEKEFFNNMRSLCVASIETGYPIVF